MQLLGKTPTDSGSEDRISLDLTAIPADVERIVVAASRYGGARFGELDDLRLALADRAASPCSASPSTLRSRRAAFLFGELYRRAREWKFRAIGQGYESGLAGLATDFGIDVDDDAAAESEDEGPEEPEAEATPDQPTGLPPQPVAAPAQPNVEPVQPNVEPAQPTASEPLKQRPPPLRRDGRVPRRRR